MIIRPQYTTHTNTYYICLMNWHTVGKNLELVISFSLLYITPGSGAETMDQQTGQSARLQRQSQQAMRMGREIKTLC